MIFTVGLEVCIGITCRKRKTKVKFASCASENITKGNLNQY